jgi:sugar phosphate isomerase/epimerase
MILDRRAFLGSVAAALCAPMARAASPAAYTLGCYTRPWDRHDLPVALDGVAEAGFRHVGLMSAGGNVRILISSKITPAATAEIHREVERRGLDVISVYGTFEMTDAADTAAANLKRLLDRCAEVHTPGLLLGGISKPAELEPYCRAIAASAEHATSLGITMSVKPHGGQNANGDQCRQMIERVNHPAFRLWYDPGNIFYYSEGALSPSDDAATVDGLVVGVSIKDFLPPKDVMVTPGTGRVDFPVVLRRLRAGGFRSGPLLVECVRPGATPTETTAEARRAREFVESVLREVES